MLAALPACRLASLQRLLNAAARFVAGLPARAIIQIPCVRCTDYKSIIGFVTSSVLWCTLSITVLVHPTSQTQLLEFRRFLEAAGSDLRTRASLKFRERERERELSLWQDTRMEWNGMEWNALPVAIGTITEVFAFKCVIKTLLIWRIFSDSFMWL